MDTDESRVSVLRCAQVANEYGLAKIFTHNIPYRRAHY
jgi:hypothetical protein